MFPKGKPTDQLNALQLIINGPQVIGTTIVVSLMTVRFDLEHCTASSAFPSMPAAMLTAPLAATVLLLSLQALVVYLGPMNSQKTIQRSTWDEQYKNSEDSLRHRWGLGALNFVCCTVFTLAFMQLLPTICSALIAAVLFSFQLHVIAAIVIPVLLCAGIAYIPMLAKTLRRD